MAGAVLLLVGCNQSGRPPELVVAPAPTTTTTAATTAAGNYTVVPGDTVHGVASRFKVPIRSLIDSNALQPPFTLTPGQQLRIPDQRVHVVAPGETLQDISRQYGVDSSTLAKMNRIVAPYMVAVGQSLVLPAPVEPMAIAAAPVVPASDPGAVESAAVEAAEPTVPAETVSVPTPSTSTGGLGAPPVVTSGSSSSDNAPLPKPDDSETVADTDADLTTDSTATDPAATDPMATDPAAEPTTDPAPSAAPAPDPVETAEPTQTAAVDPMLIEPAARANTTFLWPVNGKVISEFGGAEDGLHNDGINIAAPRGTPVRAAENGVVVYAGNELRGFGNLLLVRHADGFVSAYAHNESLLVERGATVERGQTIARVGSSGSVTSPQLHFELRRGTEAVDPREYLSDIGA
ncbi:MAG: LysM peptidoglycan-binding domain-containing M23 family metallopeptidase [Rhodospirillaceae bacterium]|nr:LysM peptidoglycan-binding domain-containing M23 family metallopeptidase [Rhodospirillaceae bacterium]